MHSPTLNLAVAQERHADLLRAAERERLAALVRTSRGRSRMHAVRERVVSVWRVRVSRAAAARPAV